MYTTRPNTMVDHWLAHVDFKIGNKDHEHRSGEGMGIYYLKDIDEDNPELMSNHYGFTNEFRGLGIMINTAQGYPDRKTKKKVVQIFGFINDGKNVKAQSKSDQQCYREVLGDYLPFSKIAIEYEKPFLRVSTYDHDAKEYVHCFSFDIPTLDYKGYFAVSASSASGTSSVPMYNVINSFKLYNPKVVAMDHHFEASHQRKADHEHFADSISARTRDLIHEGIKFIDEDGFEVIPEDMYRALAEQTYFLQPMIQDTEALLYDVRDHSNHIAEVFNSHELIDNNVRITTDLFQ